MLAAVLSAAAARLDPVTLSAQATFENTVADLASKDVKIRQRAVDTLKPVGYLEAAVPLAAAITDADDTVQLSAIAAELNIFLAERATAKKRPSFVVETRGNVAAEPIFSAGRRAVGPRRVPVQVPLALLTAMSDRNRQVAAEALYAFGALATEVAPADRPAVLRQAAPLLAGFIGASDPFQRLATIKVIGRVFAVRSGDGPIGETLGDAVIMALNDRETPVREAAMRALGAMRYDRSVQALDDLFQFYQKGLLAERALDALARIGRGAALPALGEQLHSRILAHRVLAIEGLARSDERSQYGAIQAVVDGQRDDTLALAGHFAAVRLADGPIDTIVESLRRPALHDQAYAYVLDLAAGRSAAFATHLQDPDERVRLDLVDALGLSGDADAIAVVEPLRRDANPAVALAATRAVARLRGVTPGA